ncbi:hypothetical protein ACS49_04855 [Bacillus cereus]|nr:hypothetical protein ACS49_04855 [Bacillus cereus]
MTDFGAWLVQGHHATVRTVVQTQEVVIGAQTKPRRTKFQDVVQIVSTALKVCDFDLPFFNGNNLLSCASGRI